MKILRYACCILAVLCLLAAVPIGIFLGVTYLLADLAAALLFAAVMLFAKQKSEPKTETADFMNTEEENERIRRATQTDDDGTKTE